MNFDRVLAALCSKRVLLILCIIVLGIFCLSACTVDDLLSCMLCGVPTCKTMETCSFNISYKISHCQADCTEKIEQAICDAACNSVLCYNDCAEENCASCADCTSPVECMASCTKSCFIDENGNETDCGAAGGDCDDYFVDEPDNRKE